MTARALALRARRDWVVAYLADSGSATTGPYGIRTGHSNPAIRYLTCRWNWRSSDRAYSVDCRPEGGPFRR